MMATSVDGGNINRDVRQYQYHHILPTHHHQPIFMPNINWVANGHPYKITVNNKEMKPSINPLSPTIINRANSPITWITNIWGFNGQPVNILSYPESGRKYWAGPVGEREVGVVGMLLESKCKTKQESELIETKCKLKNKGWSSSVKFFVLLENW